MQLDRLKFGRYAKELGFVRDTLEKVYRLSEVIKYFDSDELLSNAIALKGGTAINLTIFDLPRLSVDIDLDYCKSINRNEMLLDRNQITIKINKFMIANGYHLSTKTKNYHALDSFVYEYMNCGGVKDNLKIEINYMLRCHVLPLEKRNIKLPWNNKNIIVLCVNPLEIFASKTVALLSRSTPRDLYDIHKMIESNIIKEEKKELFKKIVVFYYAIGTETVIDHFKLDSIANITKALTKRELNPVLRNNEHFSLETTQKEVIDYLASILILDEDDWVFLKEFAKGNYQPQLIFKDEHCSIKNHPMAIWKCQNKT